MRNIYFEIIIKITLSILFLLCLFNMPYGYYQATRFIGMVGFLLLAYSTYEGNKTLNSTVIIYLRPLVRVPTNHS